VAQLSQRDRAAGWVSNGQKWKTGTERIFCGQYRSIFKQCDVFGQQRNRNRRKKTHNKGCYAVLGHSRSSKVIEVGTNRKPVCDFLLVINSRLTIILSRTVSEISQFIICPIAIAYSMGEIIQVAQLSQRDRAAGWVSNGQNWKTGTERQYLRTV